MTNFIDFFLTIERKFSIKFTESLLKSSLVILSALTLIF